MVQRTARIRALGGGSSSSPPLGTVGLLGKETITVCLQ